MWQQECRFRQKVLKVAFECAYAPYNWTQESPDVGNGKKAVKIKNADGYAYGYEVELAQRIADELGYELEVYKIEWSSILWDFRMVHMMLL